MLNPLKSLTEHSHATDAEKVMDLVVQTEEQMDEVLFSSVIEACIRLRRLDLLSSMMQKFDKRGHSLSLTAPTYGSMIKAFGQSRDIERIWDLWREMGSRGVKPTAITLGCMVDALVMNNRVDEAWTLIHELLEDEEMKSCVNTVIFSTILKGFAMLKKTDRVFAVHAEMVEKMTVFTQDFMSSSTSSSWIRVQASSTRLFITSASTIQPRVIAVGFTPRDP